MKDYTNRELAEKMETLEETVKIYRNRLDKYHKEQKKLKKELNRALASGQGLDSELMGSDVVRRIKIAEGEIDALANTINYFIGDTSGATTYKKPDTKTKEEKESEQEELEAKLNPKISGFDFVDKTLPETCKS